MSQKFVSLAKYSHILSDEAIVNYCSENNIDVFITKPEKMNVWGYPPALEFITERDAEIISEKGGEYWREKHERLASDLGLSSQVGLFAPKMVEGSNVLLVLQKQDLEGFKRLDEIFVRNFESIFEIDQKATSKTSEIKASSYHLKGANYNDESTSFETSNTGIGLFSAKFCLCHESTPVGVLFNDPISLRASSKISINDCFVSNEHLLEFERLIANEISEESEYSLSEEQQKYKWLLLFANIGYKVFSNESSMTKVSELLRAETGSSKPMSDTGAFILKPEQSSKSKYHSEIKQDDEESLFPFVKRLAIEMEELCSENKSVDDLVMIIMDKSGFTMDKAREVEKIIRSENVQSYGNGKLSNL